MKNGGRKGRWIEIRGVEKRKAIQLSLNSKIS